MALAFAAGILVSPRSQSTTGVDEPQAFASARSTEPQSEPRASAHLVPEFSPLSQKTTTGDPSTPIALDAASIGQAMNETNQVKRLVKLSEVLEGLSADNIDEVLAYFEQLPDGARRTREWTLLMDAWGAFDGASAAAYAQENIGGRQGRVAAMAAVSSWARTDPTSAVDWAHSQESSRGFNLFMMGAINGWTATDPTGAAQYVSQLPEGRERSRMAGVVTRNFLDQGYQAAVTWVNTLADDQFKSDAIDSVARRWAREDPAA